jgi:hypothetical protein
LLLIMHLPASRPTQYCRDPSAAGALAISQADLETALLANLGQRQRAKTLQKMRRHLAITGQQQQQQQEQQEQLGKEVQQQGELQQDGSSNGSGPTDAVACENVAAAAAQSQTGDDQDKVDEAAACEDPVNGEEAEVPADGTAAAPAICGGSSSQPSAPEARSLAELGHQWHGQQVVAAVLAESGEAGLHDLVRKFRRAFVLACKPQYLPKAWDVDKVQSREFGEYSVYAREEAAAAAAAAGGVKDAGYGSGMANGSRGASSSSSSSVDGGQESSSDDEDEEDSEAAAAGATATMNGVPQPVGLGAGAAAAAAAAAGGLVPRDSASIFSRR